MASLLTPVQILPWGGLNNGVEPLAVERNESPDCLNVRFRKRGVFKREGTSRYLNATVGGANSVTGVAQLVKGDGTVGQLAFASNDVFSETGGAWVSRKGAVSLTAGADKLWQFATQGDLLICTNDTDQIIKWTGGTNNVAALGGSPPTKARAVYSFFNYVIFLNTEEGGVRRPGRFRWSDLNAPETYPAGNVNDVVNLAGEEGLALFEIDGNLYAAFDRSVRRVIYTGNDVEPFDFFKATPTAGVISGNAIVPVDGGAFVLTEEGPGFFNGSVIEYIGKRVEGTWKNRNTARDRFAVAARSRRNTQIHFSFATGSSIQNDTTLVYDYVERKWSPDSGYAPNCYAIFPKTKPLDPVFGGYAGFVMQINDAARNDDGAAINAYANTKPLDFGREGRKIKVRKIDLVVDSQPSAESKVRLKTAYNLNAPTASSDISVAQVGPTFEDDKGTSLFDEAEFAIEGQRKVTKRTPGRGEYFIAQIGNDRLNEAMNVASMLAHVKGDEP